MGRCSVRKRWARSATVGSLSRWNLLRRYPLVEVRFHAPPPACEQGEENHFTDLCPDCGFEFDVSGTVQNLPRAEVISDRFEMGRNFCTKL